MPLNSFMGNRKIIRAMLDNRKAEILAGGHVPILSINSRLMIMLSHSGSVVLILHHKIPVE